MAKIGMKQSNVLLTGFKSTRFDESSSKIFLEQITGYDKYLFTNDFECITKETPFLHLNNYDYILMFGQKPIIKRLSLELDATKNDIIINTNYQLDYLLNALSKCHISYKISHRPGSSYCNYAYYNVLEYIKNNNLKAKVIFIHIPYIKNFVEMDKCIKFFSNGGLYAGDCRS